MSRFARDGLDLGDSVVVLATEARLTEVQNALATDPSSADEGRLFVHPAETILEAVSTEGRIDEQRFRDLALPTLAEARAVSASGDVRVTGDVVALCSGRGDFDTAVALERRWETLMTEQTLELLCFYPRAHFANEAEALAEVCGCHGHVERGDDFARAELSSALRAAHRTLATRALIGSGIGHDIRNMVSIVVGAAEYLREDLGEVVAEDVADILVACEHVDALAHQLLSRGGRAASVIDATAEVRRLQRILERAARSRAELVFELGDDVGSIACAAEQLGSVLLNMVLNACEAVESGTRIVVSTRVAERAGRPQVCIAVADAGPGLPGDARRVFEPFYSTKANGAGVGLTTVKRVVEEAGGQVEVSSVPGTGTTFELWFASLG